MKDYIGRQRCKFLTPYATGLYNSTINDMKISDAHESQDTVKKRFDWIVDSGHGKAIRVDTLLDFARADEDSQLKDINKDIDDVIAMVVDLCIISSWEVSNGPRKAQWIRVNFRTIDGSNLSTPIYITPWLMWFFYVSIFYNLLYKISNSGTFLFLIYFLDICTLSKISSSREFYIFS